MKLRKVWKKALAMLLAGCMFAAIPGGVYAAEAVAEIEEESEIENLESYQAVNDPKAQMKTDGNTVLVESEDFQAEISFGLEGHYRMGALMPVNLRLTSKKADFTGHVRVIVPRTYNWNSPVTTAYEAGVLLPAGSEKQYSIALSNRSSAAYFYLEIVDEADRVLLKQMVPVRASVNELALVGIMSDDYPALSYFDKAYINTDWYAGNTELVELDEKNFPIEVDALDAMGLLIISSFDTGRLSEQQQQVLKDWIAKGGALLLGGGADYRQTISAFSEELKEIKVGPARDGQLQLKSGAGDALAYSAKDHLLNFTGNSEDELFEERNLIRKIPYGSGLILYTAFNPAMKPVSDWNDRDKMAEELLSYMAKGYVGRRLSAINHGDMEYEMQFSANFPIKHPNLVFLSALLLLFAIFLPIAFWLLKKLDRTILLWFLIPGASLLVTGVILLSTLNLRVNRQIVNTVTLIEQEDNMAVNKAISIQALMPRTGWNQLTFTDQIKRIRQANDYYSTGFANHKSFSEEYECILGKDGANCSYAYRNSSIFSSMALKGEAAQPLQQGNLEIRLLQSESGLKGTITNHTGMDLKGIALLTRGEYYGLESIAAGETLTVSAEEVQTAGYIWDLAWPDIQDVHMAEELRSMYITVNDQLYESYHQPTEDRKPCALIAYADKYDTDYVLDENVEECNHALYYVPLTLAYEGYEDAVTLNLRDYCEGNDGWDQYDGQIYQNDFYTRADFGQMIDNIYLLQRYGNTSYRYGDTENTVIYAFNYEVEAYEELFTDSNLMTFEEQCPYIREGEMNLRITCQTPYDDYVPEVLVIGGADNAGN